MPLLLCLLVACKGAIGPTPSEEPLPDGTTPPPADVYLASESVARRLSQAELDRTLLHLLGDDTSPARTFLFEDEFSPFDNDYTLQEASTTLIDGLDALAEDVADRVTSDPARRDALVGCTPENDGDQACFRSFLETFQRRAFRRPVTTEDVDPYMVLLDYATEDNPNVQNDFYTAVNLAIRAVLQDPEFLYRIEVGAATETTGLVRLNGIEVASRMSYFLWGSMPDDLLLEDAEAGRLDTVEGRRAAAERMLADDKAKAQLSRFHAMWLGYRAIPAAPNLIGRFSNETNQLIERIVFDERRPYSDLFLSDETYVDDALATHYGLDAPQGGEGWVAYGEDRAGILSHGAVLAAFSKFSDTSPTQRGIFIRTRLMCDDLPPPPPQIDVDQPPEGGANDCKVERYMAHMGTGSCNNCHKEMDPIGFGLEQFDIAGRFRAHDDGRPECAIEGVGTLPDNTTFSGPKELAQILTANNEIQSCAVATLYRYAVGRKPSSVERQPIDALASTFAGGGERLDELLVAYVTSDAFGMRMEPTP